ncbi:MULTISPECIES: hypothetical protein [unclassified Prochlorococcus]|uniref:hypothetical protein n=1 Tax=unclassified Prochlorococcus TaxID=2627481 RepID=UPI000533B7C1|nr:MULTISPECIES: hypothetical protein [unclassified Prochlorococcus]KGG14636.1 hypothetical protein EV06_1695 [Prochlorococcus sp. MIT 0602]KGG15935.1 hypothetical protein EV07_1902 [Prochlorococcus sp. MIT 0603]
MNAANEVRTIVFAQTLASAGTLVKKYFPAASINFSPWREDPDTEFWFDEDSLDLAFYFPGWTPSLQCRSLLIQLKVRKDNSMDLPRLLGVIIRGISFDGERWRLSTLGDWKPTGSHLPQPLIRDQLHSLCRDLFTLFRSDSVC